MRYVSASAGRPRKDAASAAHRQNAGLQPNSSAAATRSASAAESSSGVEPPLMLSAGRAHAARKEAARPTHDAAISQILACCTRSSLEIRADGSLGARGPGFHPESVALGGVRLIQVESLHAAWWISTVTWESIGK